MTGLFKQSHAAVNDAIESGMQQEQRHRHHQTNLGSDQRFGDTAGEHAGIADALGGDHGEDLDHADYGAEQTEERGDGSDGAERVQVSFEIVRDMPADVLEMLLHDLSRHSSSGDTFSENSPER